MRRGDSTPLVALLVGGTSGGRRDALTTRYKLCSARRNGTRRAGGEPGGGSPAVEGGRARRWARTRSLLRWCWMGRLAGDYGGEARRWSLRWGDSDVGEEHSKRAGAWEASSRCTFCPDRAESAQQVPPRREGRHPRRLAPRAVRILALPSKRYAPPPSSAFLRGHRLHHPQFFYSAIQHSEREAHRCLRCTHVNTGEMLSGYLREQRQGRWGDRRPGRVT
ncbi:hypothetical protein C4D60_Mb00t19480 [Musa balbisiana]|uniref:Uncharacterized protein n=1 Tax=Musa balbisiana TaxID=52838 RepID=A0A4S8I2A2_MUSBA|nr:hypothetical protein C4D60_Mb00t19480 [Musa balbisiana]